jgi:hypothetical protein
VTFHDRINTFFRNVNRHVASTGILVRFSSSKEGRPFLQQGKHCKKKFLQSMENLKFSHVVYEAGYMQVIVRAVNNFFQGNVTGRKILDMPAGYGWVSDTLSKMGASTVPADFNDERSDFVHAVRASNIYFDPKRLWRNLPEC